VSISVDGNSVVLRPIPALFGGPVLVTANVADNSGGRASVQLSFGVLPSLDTTPPVLEYSFPAPGSVIPAFSSRMSLRFSEPVIVTQQAIRIIGASGGAGGFQGGVLGSDQRTLVFPVYLNPESDITVSVTSDVTDLSGNPLVPVSFRLRTLSAAESNGPQVDSVSPPGGATNVPVDAAIQLRFTHAMDAVSVGLGLHVIVDGAVATGSTASSDGRNFRFQPDLPFRKGSIVDIAMAEPATDSAGQKLASFASSFTVIKDATAEPTPVLVSAAPAAIDVRFDAPLLPPIDAPYVREGSERVPSHWEMRAPDWLRIVPDRPLPANGAYRLVVNAHTDLPVFLVRDDSEALIESQTFDGQTVRIRFTRPINPATIGPETLQLTGPDGAPVAYSVSTSLDRRELQLKPATSQEQVWLAIEHVESAGGRPVRAGKRELLRRSSP
jgi:Bacterial Ig-like domain